MTLTANFSTPFRWVPLFPSTNPAFGACIAYDEARQQTVLFSGNDRSGAEVSQTWIWDGGNWSQKLPAHSPLPRSLCAMAFDAAHGQVVLFGGRPAADDGDFADTWTWDGNDWTEQHPPTIPHFPCIYFDGYLRRRAPKHNALWRRSQNRRRKP